MKYRVRRLSRLGRRWVQTTSACRIDYMPPKERIEAAKNDWKLGRFDKVFGDEKEFIPLPAA